MSTEFNAPIQACTDPRHTGALRAQLGCNGPDPADQAVATPAPSTRQAEPVRYRINAAVTAEYLRRVEEIPEATVEEHCDALTSAVMAALRTVASEMEQRHWGGNCPHCAAYLTNLTATVQERVGGQACPLCAEYLALKQRAESTEAAARPLLDPAARTEPTYRERIAAALFEEHIRKPWAMAYPSDTLSYLQDADVFLAIRDAEMTELRRQAEAASAVTTAHAVARGFRLVQRNGAVLDAAQFPNGRVIVMDDPHWGLCSGARSLELLLRSGYDGARLEFADEQLHDSLAALERVRSYLEARQDQVAVDPAEVFNILTGAAQQPSSGEASGE
ncbi:hypothetical protein [Streptomyces cyaneofuscatus]|uniref:hypothetical protein n=1 Tax=Streptomyces cyaneofuscatus TaxID=66883 RepID=UPI003793CD14